MKRIIFGFIITVLIASFFTTFGFAQNNLGKINQSLKSGDASNLAQYFNHSLEITILDDENTFNKTVATQKVKSFFASHKPNSFVIKHQGTAPNGSKYVIGALTTSKGTFRTYFVIANGLIQELAFED
ncbi:MAG: DUF4783 domain-containing protein [Chitinophagales bacterium]